MHQALGTNCLFRSSRKSARSLQQIIERRWQRCARNSMFSSESSSQGVLYLSTKLSLATMLDRKPTLFFFFLLLLLQSLQMYVEDKKKNNSAVKCAFRICLHESNDIKGIFKCGHPGIADATEGGSHGGWMFICYVIIKVGRAGDFGEVSAVQDSVHASSCICSRAMFRTKKCTKSQFVCVMLGWLHALASSFESV